MPKNRIFHIITSIVLILSVSGSAYCVDWVHPNNRNQYKGYEKLKDQKKNSRIWTYATNRPGGNTTGGGTTPYKEYQPNYKPPVEFGKYNYKRSVKLGDDPQNECNCEK